MARWRVGNAALGISETFPHQKPLPVTGYGNGAKNHLLFFDAVGKPVVSSEITALSLATLTADKFAFPAGYKKVTRAEYDAARS